MSSSDEAWLLHIVGVFSPSSLPLCLFNAAQWHTFRSRGMGPTKLATEFERLRASGEVDRWKKHTAYCRRHQVVPTSSMCMDLWEARVDLDSAVRAVRSADTSTAVSQA